MTEPRRGVSRRGLLGILGQGLRELRKPKAGEEPSAEAERAPAAPASPRRARPPSEVREGVCDGPGPMTIDLRERPLAVGASARADGVGFPVPVVLVRVHETHYAACSTTCPADGSDVLWSETGDLLWCPSCGSRWRLDGSLARGPAVRPLRSFVVQEAEGVVRVLPE